MRADDSNRWLYMQQSAEIALSYWAQTVNQQNLQAQDGQTLRVLLTIRDWGFFPEACTSAGMQLFERMILGLEDNGQPMLDPFDFIFLPSYYEFSLPIQTQMMTARNMATMAFHHMQGEPLPFQEVYQFEAEPVPPVYEVPFAQDVPPIIAWMPDLMVGESSQYEVCGSLTVPEAVLAPQEEEVNRPEGCFNLVPCKKFSDSDGMASRLAKETAQNITVLDMNLPTGTWALDAIDRIVGAGGANQSWMFVTGYLESAGIQDPAHSNCDVYMDYVSSVHGRTVSEYVVDASGYPIDDAEVIKSVAPDVLFHCGDEQYLMLVAAAFIASDFSPSAFLTDRPLSPTAYKYLQAFNVNYMIDVLPIAPPEHSRPCPVFGTYKDFLDGFESYARQHHPDWVERNGGALPDLSALQAAVTGAAFIAASMDARTTRSSDLVNYLTDTGVDTFGGRVQFGATGRRLTIPTTMRQLRPVDRYPDQPEIRLYKSDSLVVSSAARDGCQYGATACDSLYLSDEQLAYPAPDSRERLFETYPCIAGCYMTSTRFPDCNSCPLGTFRGDGQLDCAPCLEGYFSEFVGRRFCTSCPAGADCSNASSAPRASKGFFQTAGQQCADNITSLMDAARGTQLPAKACISPHATCQYAFAACRPQELCLGDGVCWGHQTGYLCGNCEAGYGRHGFFPGLRRCTQCPASMATIYASFAGLAVFWLVLVCMVVRLAQRSTHSSERPASCSLRCLWHYIIMANIILETSRLDSLGLISNILAPTMVLYRPLDIVYFECWVDLQGWDAIERAAQIVRAYRRLAPAGAAVFVLVFVLDVLVRENREIVKLLKFAFKKFRDGHGRSGSDDDSDAGSSVGWGSDVETNAKDPQLKTMLRHGSIVKWHLYTRRVGTMVHCIIVWIVLIQPACLRGITVYTACVKVKVGKHTLERRSVMDYDIQCDTEEFFDLQIGGSVARDTLAFFVPGGLLLFCYLIGSQRFLFDILVRHATVFLTDGYRPTAYYWEFVLMLRTSLLIGAMAEESAIDRHGNIIFVLMCYMSHKAAMEPIAWRFLSASSSYLLFACMLLITVGVVYSLEVDEAMHGMFTTLEFLKDPFLYFGLFVNGCAFFNHAAWTYFKVQSVTLEILMESGNVVSPTTLNFHTFVRICGGLNRVYYFKDEGGRYTIDAKRLNQRERADLLDMLKNMVSACIDSGPFYHAYLMENAVHEVFMRAIEARQQRVRNTYSIYGQKDRTLIGCPWCKMMMRQPDIPLFESELPRRPKQVLNSLARRLGIKAPPVASDAATHRDAYSLTIEELRAASQAVMVDVLEHRPTLHQPPPERKRSRRSSDARLHSDVCQWKTEPCSTIQEDMQGRGILMDYGTAPRFGRARGPSFVLHPKQADFLGLQAVSEQPALVPKQLRLEGDDFLEAQFVVRSKILHLEESMLHTKAEIRGVRQSGFEVFEDSWTPATGRENACPINGKRLRQQRREQFVRHSLKLVDRIERSLKAMQAAELRRRTS